MPSPWLISATIHASPTALSLSTPAHLDRGFS